ncbi:MAG: hypothetical protein AB7S99_05005 [Pseudodonghicola sp.]
MHRVTDHAVLRYLERVEGMDIERIRREIGRKVDLAVELGASAAIVDGMAYQLSPCGTVTTVMPHSRPERRSGRRDKNGGQSC